MVDPAGLSAATLRYLNLVNNNSKPSDDILVLFKSQKRPAVDLSLSGGENSINATEPSSEKSRTVSMYDSDKSAQLEASSTSTLPSQTLANDTSLATSFQQSHHETSCNTTFGKSQDIMQDMENCDSSALFCIDPPPIQDVFKSPPMKRSRQDRFVQQNCSLATEYLFGDKSIAPTIIYSQLRDNAGILTTDVSDDGNDLELIESSMEISGNKLSTTNNQQFTSSYDDSQIIEETQIDETCSIIDDFMMSIQCREQSLEASFMSNRKVNVSTIYSNRLMMKTSPNVIDNYYKVQKVDWNAVAEDMAEKIDLIEPTLDYLHAKLWGNERIVVGKSEQEICDEEAFNCNFLHESLMEIENSFENSNHSIVSSTPKAIRCRSSESSQRDVRCESKNISEPPKGDTQNTADITQISQSNASESIVIPYDISRILTGNAMESIILLRNGDGNSKERIDSLTQEPDFHGFSNAQQNHMQEMLPSPNPSEALQELSQQNPALVETRRDAILSQIANIVHAQLESIVKRKPMVLKVRKIKDWKDCVMNNDVLSPNETRIPTRTISFTNKNSKKTFAVVIVILCEIYKTLARNLTCTKRELYYRDVELYGSQESVDKAVDTICSMLNVQQFELGLLSSSKGLIAGNLVINIGDERIDCTTSQAVPQNVSEITSFESTADYVLIVEKDTVFQRFIADNIFERIDAKIILVTAKGYPDINTRMLLKKMSTELRIPLYILVDADPHGVEIMCTYKFGSLMKVHNSEHLAVPEIEWIGIYPSDIESLDVTNVELTAADLKKVDELLQRPYLNAQLKRELKCFQARRSKAEIESVYHFSIDYLINDYIPRKIRLLPMPNIR